ncbi:MAG TPA: glycosyltransferase family 2 protein, partial [Gaiellaceae bacterium]|nr:glycosyltransferase family 2 protein [Gaiellaceae bacterium]
MPGATVVDVVIVAYRSRDHLPRCLDSLAREAERVPLTVTVVDNASHDGTTELVARDFPWVELVALEENTGFARATNLGASRGTAPHLLALNPDTELPPGTLERLLAIFPEHPEVAVAGPRLEREDGSFDHAARRAFPTIAGALGHFSGAARLVRTDRLLQYRAPRVDRGVVDSVNGAFMLMRRAAFEEVGGFDEGYWLYMEDLDLSYRLAEAGRLSWYEPSVTVLHAKGASAGPVRSARLEVAFHRGMRRFYRSHYGPQRARVTNAAVEA